MTRRERFFALMNFEKVDRVPRYCTFIPSLQEMIKTRLGEDPSVHFAMDKWSSSFLIPPDGFKCPDYSSYHPGRVHGRDNFTIDENGCGHLGHGFYHFTEYISPLRSAQSIDELVAYPVVDRTTWLDTAIRESVERCRKEGRYSAVFAGHMYESAWQIRGYEQFLEDLLLQPEWAEVILDKIHRNNLHVAKVAAKAGCDLIRFGDDIANQNALMFSPDTWRRFMKPRWAKVLAAAREIKKDVFFWYHSDGNPSAVLDDLVEIGVNILNPVQPECVNPVEIRKRYGRRLAFDGCVGTQTTFPFGTPADMKRVVHELADGLNARSGGLMLSPTHVLEPEVPPENVFAFFEACDELKGTAILGPGELASPDRKTGEKKRACVSSLQPSSPVRN